MSIDARFRLTLGQFRLDVALTLPAAGVSALFGRSGSGKTTVLRCIAGLERAAGELRINGERWQDGSYFLPTHARPLGYVFQEASLFPHLDVRGNLLFGWRRLKPAERRVAVDDTVALLGLEPLLTQRVDQLSGGQRQRVAIGRALLGSPRLLLMDEPLASLDQQSKAEILPFLERLREELQIPLIYVSHSPDEVARLADHLVLLEAGRVRAAGPLTELLTRPDLPLAHTADAGSVLPARVVEHDSAYHLTRLAVPGGELYLPRTPLAPGSHTRLRIHARDVSVAISRPRDSSILNVLPATVLDITPDDDPAQVLLRLQVADGLLLARITRRSCEQLRLTAGSAVFAQVKGVALAH